MPSDDPFYVDDFTFSPVIIRRHLRTPSAEEFIESQQSMQAQIDGPGRLGFVLLYSAGVGASLGERKLIAKFIDDNRAYLENECYGAAVVFTSAALRFVLASILLITTMPGRIKGCASLEDALAHIVEGIVEANDDVPPLLQPYLARSGRTAAAGRSLNNSASA